MLCYVSVNERMPRVVTLHARVLFVYYMAGDNQLSMVSVVA